VKGASSKGDFPDAEIGHILDLAKVLLRSYQVFRRVLYCFLTDGERFQFFRVERRIDGFFFQQSSVFSNTMGWQILLGLLRSNLPALGYEALSVQGVSILEYLGRGGSCVALKGKLDSGETDDVVVKVFDDAEAMNNEKRTLNTLSGIENISTCLGVFDVLVDGKPSIKTALVCSPVGDVVLPIKSGRSTKGSHLSDLVTILKQAHEKGIVHRDVKPENVFLVNDTVLLNDWGISCSISDEFIPWKGTVAYCDPPTHDDSRHCPTPSTDLRSLVRCAYAMTFLETEVPQNIDFWTCRLASGLWKRGMDAADALNYDALRNVFQDLRC
jgi:serine/threonine protein kinase